jgi:hypothetical protein
MEDREKQIDILEQQFPKQSGIALAAAYQHSIESGQKVLQVIEGQLWEVSKNERRIVKDVEPDIHIGAGTSFNIA